MYTAIKMKRIPKSNGHIFCDLSNNIIDTKTIAAMKEVINEILTAIWRGEAAFMIRIFKVPNE